MNDTLVLAHLHDRLLAVLISRLDLRPCPNDENPSAVSNEDVTALAAFG
jgi:hypothetical protein